MVGYDQIEGTFSLAIAGLYGTPYYALGWSIQWILPTKVESKNVESKKI